MAKVICYCKQCGRAFEVYRCHLNFNPAVGTFCSIACKAEYQRANWKADKHPTWKPEAHIVRQCITCGTVFTVQTKQLKLKGGGSYCSKKCLGRMRRLQFLWNNPNLRRSAQEKQMTHRNDPEYRERHLRATLQGLLKRPTSLERNLIKFFAAHNLPFKYVGDGSFLIGFKNPDFVNTNGRKIVIEVSNAYFRRNTPNWVRERKEHFLKYGWDCIILQTDQRYLSDKLLIATIGKELEERGIKI